MFPVPRKSITMCGASPWLGVVAEKDPSYQLQSTGLHGDNEHKTSTPKRQMGLNTDAKPPHQKAIKETSLFRPEASQIIELWGGDIQTAFPPCVSHRTQNSSAQSGFAKCPWLTERRVWLAKATLCRERHVRLVKQRHSGKTSIPSRSS